LSEVERVKQVTINDVEGFLRKTDDGFVFVIEEQPYFYVPITDESVTKYEQATYSGELKVETSERIENAKKIWNGLMKIANNEEIIFSGEKVENELFLIDKLIKAQIKKGKTAEEIRQSLSNRGYFPMNPSINTFTPAIQSIINGRYESLQDIVNATYETPSTKQDSADFIYQVEYEGRLAKISRPSRSIPITGESLNNLRVHSKEDFTSMKLKKDMDKVRQSRDARLSRLIDHKDNLLDEEGNSLLFELDTTITAFENEMKNLESTDIDQVTDKNLVKIVENLIKKQTGETRQILEDDGVADMTADELREYFEPELRVLDSEERTVSLKTIKTNTPEGVIPVSGVLPKALFSAMRAGVARNSKLREKIDELRKKLQADDSISEYLRSIEQEINILNEFIEDTEVLSPIESENRTQTINKLEAEKERIEKLRDAAGEFSETSDEFLENILDSDEKINKIDIAIENLRKAYADFDELIEAEVESQAEAYEQKAIKSKGEIINSQTPEEPTLEEIEDTEEIFAETTLRAFNPGKTAGRQLEFDFKVVNEKLKVFVRADKTDENGLPILTSNENLVRWYLTLNNLDSQEGIAGIESVENLRIRFVKADDPLIADKLFLIDEESSALSERGLSKNEDGSVFVSNVEKFESFLNTYQSDLTENQKEFIKEATKGLEKGNPLTHAEMDVLFRYSKDFEGAEVDTKQNTLNGPGVYAIIADQDGQPILFNEESSSVDENGDIRFVPIQRKIAGNFQLKNNIARYHAEDRGESPMPWEALKESLLRDYSNVDQQKALEQIEITINNADGNPVTVTAAEVDKAERLEELPNEVKIIVEARLQKEIDQIRNQRLAVLNAFESGKPVISTEFNLSDGLEIRLNQPNRPLLGSLIENVNDITDMTVIMTEGSAIFKNADKRTTTRRAKPGQVWLSLKNGTKLPVDRRGLTDQKPDRAGALSEVDLIMKMIEIEANNGITNEPLVVTRAVDRDGNPVSGLRNLPIIRHLRTGQKTPPPAGIDRIISWSYPTAERKPWTIYFDLNAKDRGREYIFFGEDGEIALDDIRNGNRVKLDRLRKWLINNRLRNINQKFVNGENYFHPINIRQQGSEITLVVDVFTQKDHSIPYLAHLVQDDVLESNVISQSESKAIGLEGHQITSRYVTFGDANDVVTVEDDGTYSKEDGTTVEPTLEKTKKITRVDYRNEGKQVRIINKRTEKTVKDSDGNDLIGKLEGKFKRGDTIFYRIETETGIKDIDDTDLLLDTRTVYVKGDYKEEVVDIENTTFEEMFNRFKNKRTGILKINEILVSHKFKVNDDVFETSFVLSIDGVDVSVVNHSENRVILNGVENEKAKDQIFKFLKDKVGEDPTHGGAFYDNIIRGYFEDGFNPAKTSIHKSKINDGWQSDEEGPHPFSELSEVVTVVFNPKFASMKDVEKEGDVTEMDYDTLMTAIVDQEDSEVKDRAEEIQALINEIIPDTSILTFVFTKGDYTAAVDRKNVNRILIGKKFNEDSKDGMRDLIILHELVHTATIKPILANIKGKLKGDKKVAVDSLISARNEIIERVLRGQIPSNELMHYYLLGLKYNRKKNGKQVTSAFNKLIAEHKKSATNPTAEDLFTLLEETLPVEDVNQMRKDVVEFVAGVIERDELQVRMNKIKDENNLSILERIIQAISNILGIDVQKGTLLHRAILDVKKISEPEINKADTIAEEKYEKPIRKAEKESSKNFSADSEKTNDLEDQIPDPEEIAETNEDDEDDNLDLPYNDITEFEDDDDVAGYPDFTTNQLTNFSEFLNNPNEEDLQEFLESIGFDVDPNSHSELLERIINFLNGSTETPNTENEELDQIIMNLATDNDRLLNNVKIEQVSNVMFEDGYVLESVATRAVMNALTRGVIHELVLNQKDPVKIIEGIQDFNQLQKAYDKAFRDLKKSINARIESVESTDPKLAKNLLELRDVIFQPKNKKRLSELHAVLELRSYDVKIDEESYSEFQRTGDYNSYKDSITFNTKDMAPAVIKLMIAAIPKQGVKYDKVLSEKDPEKAMKQGLSFKLNEKLRNAYKERKDKIDKAIEADKKRAENRGYATEEEAKRIRKNRLRRLQDQRILDTNWVIKLEDYTDNLFGHPELEDFERSWNYLQKNLANLPADFTVIMEKISDLITRQTTAAKKDGIFGLAQLNNILGRTTKLGSAASVAIRNEFVQSFTKARMTHYITLLNDKGTVYSIDANKATETGILIREWRSNFIEKLKEYNLANGNDPDMFTAAHRQSLVQQMSKADKKTTKNVLKQLGIVSKNFSEVWDYFNGDLLQMTRDIVNNLVTNPKEKDLDLKLDIYDARKSDVIGTINKIARAHVELQNDVIENQFIDPVGNTNYAISLKHALNDATAKMSYIGSKFSDYLQRKKAMKEMMPHLFSPFSENSLIKEAIFTDGSTIETGVVSGMREERTGLRGRKTSTLGRPDLYVQRFHDTLNGRFVINQAADRSVTNTISIKSNRTNEAILLFPNRQAAISAFSGYLVDEINSAGMARAGIGEDIIYYKGKGKKLRHMKSIIQDPKAKEAVNKLIESVKESGKLITKDEFLEREDLQLFENEFKIYFAKRKEEVKKQLNRYGLIDRSPLVEVYDEDTNTSKFQERLVIGPPNNRQQVATYVGIDVELFAQYAEQLRTNDPNKILDHMIEMFVINQEGAYIEQAKMFFWRSCDV
jgi:hypothetical protein